MNKHTHEQSGSILVSIMIVTVFIVTILFSLMELASSNIFLARKRIFALQAQYAAESGAAARPAFFAGSVARARCSSSPR